MKLSVVAVDSGYKVEAETEYGGDVYALHHIAERKRDIRDSAGFLMAQMVRFYHGHRD